MATTITMVTRQGKCSDGVTQAATIEVEGTNGRSFTWCGGEPALLGIMDFLSNLKLVDSRVALKLVHK